MTAGERRYNVLLQWFGKIEQFHRINNDCFHYEIIVYHFSDDKVKPKIERIFNIWEQRGIYNEEFISDLNDLLSINPAKKPHLTDADDEQASITIGNVKNCIRLEKETDKIFKLLPKNPFYDTETLNILKGKLITRVIIIGNNK